MPTPHDSTSNVRSLFNVGIEKMNASRIDEATEIFSQILNSSITEGLRMFTLRERALCHHMLKQHELAAADCTALLACKGISDETKARALRIRAHSYRALRMVDEAIADYNAAFEHCETNDEAAQTLASRAALFGNLGDETAALADYQYALDMEGLAPEVKADIIRARGAFLCVRGNPARGIEDFRAALSIIGISDRLAAQTHSELAYTWYLAGDFSAAIKDAQTAVKLNPKNAMARFNLALSHLAAGQPDTALAQYRQAAADCISRAQVRKDGLGDLEDLSRKSPHLAGIKEAIGILHKFEAALKF